jgi:hypothetical protein
MRRPISPHATSVALAVVAAAAAVAAPASSQAARNFTFTDAEFMRAADGMHAARAFVAEALPPGLPMREAVARMTRAGTACDAASDGSGAVRCRYYITVRPEYGDLGEDVWTVRLTPGAGGVLQDATLRRSRVGLSDPSQ